MKPFMKSLTSGASLLALGMMASMPAMAQDSDQDTERKKTSAEILMEEISITGTKKSRAENLQDVATAVTAFSADQLDTLHVRSLQSLSFSMPNVALEDVGTTKGVANFSIRGLGINSSIPSIDPTVGVFVDGMYYGVNIGVVFDTFDLEGIEVLRGPQGLLFGRNVTGGAVVLRTKKPTDEFEVSGKLAIDSGLRGTGENYYAMGSVSGPIVEGKLKAKFAAYYNKDKGWHENLFDGGNVGASRTTIFRPALSFTPSDSFELMLRYEHGDMEGDGPATQNRGVFDRNSFDMAYDEVGFADAKWDQLIAEANWDVDFGDGKITNIFAWRELEMSSLSDIDSIDDRLGLPVPFLFHAGFGTTQDQWSNEIRYSGRFNDSFDFTTGFYYFTQDIEYQESRSLPPTGLDMSGGGIQDHKTWGAFAQADIDVSDKLILTLGARYTHEKKEVQIASLLVNATPTVGQVILPSAPGGCNIATRDCVFDFPGLNGDGEKSWNSFTPKIGIKYMLNDDTNVYAHWTRGFRSGGYNFRNTSPTATPGPFDDESQNSYEVGLKYQSSDKKVRLNTAVFLNDISDMQREINLADPIAGVVQIIDNTADAEIFGVEMEGQFLVTPNLILTGSLGYLDGDYTEILFDLDGDGVLGDSDMDLALPRLAKWTYGFGATYDMDLGDNGNLTWRATFNHRNKSYYTDNNAGFLNPADMLDANIAWRMPNNNVTFSVYGKNLLNEVTAGGDTQLPFFPGATLSPLNKGAVFGLEVNFGF